MSAIKYLANVSKSMAYSTIDVLKDMNPTLTSFADTNADIGTATYRAIRDWRITSKKVSRAVKESEYTQLAAKGVKTAWADLKSGKWYDKERIERAESMAIDAMLDDNNPFGDIEGFDENDNFNDISISGDTSFLAGAVDDVGGRSSTAVSTAILKSAELQMTATGEIYKKERINSSIMYSGIRSDIAAMNNNLANMVRFDSDIMQVHVKNSTDYYTNHTNLVTEIRDMMKEVLDTQKVVGNNTNTDHVDTSIRFRDVLDSEGNVDISNFGKYTFNKISDGGNGTLSIVKQMIDSGMFESYAAAPLQFLTKGIMKKMVAPSLKSAFGDLNKTISGTFVSALMKGQEWQYDENPIKNFLGNIFGIDESLTNTFDTSRYDKGKAIWTGKDHVALTEVLPTLLSSIDSHLGGEYQKFNYSTGKWVKKQKIQKEYDSMYRNAALQSASGIYYDYLNPAIDSLQFQTKADEEAFRESITKVLETNFKNTSMFNPNKKHSASEFGINIGTEEENEAVMRRIEELWSTAIPKGAQMSYNTDLVNYMQMLNDDIKRLENSGDSLYNTLFNDFSHGSRNNIIPIQSQDLTAAGGNSNRDNNIVGHRSNNANDDIRPDNENINVQDLSIDNENLDEWSRSVLLSDYASNPGHFDNRVLKSGYIIKNGKVQRKSIGFRTGVRPVDTLIDSITGNVNTSNSINDRLEDAESPIVKFVNKISDSIYDKFFPKDEESSEEEHMTLTQKLAHSMSKYVNEAPTKLQESIDKLKGKFTRENLKGFVKDWFNIDTDKVKEYFTDTLFGRNVDGDQKDGIFGNVINSFKVGFKGVWKWFKNSATDITKWISEDDETIARDAHNARVRDLLMRSIGSDEERTDVLDNQEDTETVNPIDRLLDRSEPHSAGDVIKGNNIPAGKHTRLILASEGETVVPNEELNEDGGNRNTTTLFQRMKWEKEALSKVMSGEEADDKVYQNVWDALLSKNNYTKLAILFKKNKGFTKWVRSDKDKVKTLDSISRLKTRTTISENPEQITVKDRFKYIGNRVLGEAKNALHISGELATDILSNVADESGISKEDKERFNNQVKIVGEEIKTYFPNFLTGAALGAGASLITGAIGGPLLGAAAGAGIGLLTGSDKLQKLVFGDIDELGKRKGGLLPADISNIITKYAPNMAKGATLGAITSIIPFVPGGPIAGMMVGSAVGYVTKSEKAQEAIFGMFGDNLDKNKFRKKVQSALPKMGLGAVAGVLAGPFGLATNAILGASLGFASDSDKFKNMIFGVKGEDGKYHGGMYGAVKDWLSDNFTQPVKKLMSPLTTQFKVMFESIGNGITNIVKGVVDKISNRLTNSRLFKGLMGVGKKVGKLAMLPITAPIKLAGMAASGLTNSLDRHQLKVGTAYRGKDMRTATMRLERARELGIRGYTGQQDDMAISNMDIDTISSARDAAATIADSKKYIKNIKDEQHSSISKVLESKPYKNISKEVKVTIRKYVDKGDIDGAVSTVNKLTFLSNKDKEELLKYVSTYTKKVNAANKLESNITQGRDDAFKALNAMGFNVSSKTNFKALQDKLEQEKKSIEKDNTLYEEEVDARLQSSTDEMVETLKEINNNLKDLLSPERLNRATGEVASNRALSKKEQKKLARRSLKTIAIDNLIDLEDENSMKETYDMLTSSGYSDDQANRLIEKAKTRQNGSLVTRTKNAVTGGISNTVKSAENSYNEHRQNRFDSYVEKHGYTREEKQYTTGSKIIYSYNSSGKPIRIKQDERGNQIVDMSDSETAENIQESNREKEEQKSIFGSMKDSIVGIFGRFRKKDKEDADGEKSGKTGLLGTLSKFFFGSSTTAKVLTLGAASMIGVGIADKIGLVDSLGNFLENKFGPWITGTAIPYFTETLMPKIIDGLGGLATLITNGAEVVFAKVLPAVIPALVAALPDIAGSILKGIAQLPSGIANALKNKKDPDDLYKVSSSSTSSIQSASLANFPSSVNKTVNGVSMSYNVNPSIVNASTQAMQMKGASYGLETPNSISSTSESTTVTKQTASAAVLNKSVKGTPSIKYSSSNNLISTKGTDNGLPLAFNYCNDAIYTKAKSQYDKLQSNIVNVNGQRMSVSDILNSEVYVASITDQDGTEVPVYGYQVLKYPYVADMLGFDIHLTQDERDKQQKNLGIKSDETRLTQRLALSAAEAIVNPKAATNTARGLSTVGKGLKTAGKVLTKNKIVKHLPGAKIFGHLSNGAANIANVGSTAVRGLKDVGGALRGEGLINPFASSKGLDLADTAVELVDDVSAPSSRIVSKVKDVANGVSKKITTGTKGVVSSASNKLTTVAKKVVGEENTGIISKFVKAIPEKLSGFMKNSKVFSMFKNAASKIGTVLDERVYNKVIIELGEKLAKKLSETALAKVGAAVAKITASVGTAGIFTIASAVAGFINGYSNANSVMGLTEQPSFPLRCICGVVYALNEAFCLGLIPIDIIFNLVYSVLKVIFPKLQDSDFEKERQAAEEEVAAYNAEHGTDLTLEEYNKKDRLWSKAKNSVKGFWNRLTGKEDPEAELLTDTVSVDNEQYLGASNVSAEQQYYNSVTTGSSNINSSNDNSLSNSSLGSALKGILFPASLGVDVLRSEKGQEMISHVKQTTGKAVDYVTGGAFNDSTVRKKLGLNDNVELTIADRASVYIGGISEKLFGKDTTTVVNGALLTVQDSIKKMPSAINNTLGSILGFEDEDGNPMSLTDAAGRKIDQIKTGATAIWTNVKDKSIEIATSVKDSISDVYDKVNSKVKLGADRLNNTIGGIFGFSDEDGNPISFTQGISNKYNKVKDSISTTVSNVYSTVKGVWDTIGNKVSDISEKVGKNIKTMADNLNNTIGGFFGFADKDGNPISFTDGLKATARGVKTALSSVKGWFSSIGSSLSNISTNSAESRNANAGSGSGITDTFVSQRDPKYANKIFNISKDTKRQTVSDTGCAPASAIMAVNMAKGSGITMDAAIEHASRYKQQDDGVTPDYFADEFSRNGMGTSYIDGQNKSEDIKNILYSGKPVVLMGQDRNNTSKSKSPFGPHSHYVVANGLSGDGSKIYINDPEASRGNIEYSSDDILNSTKLGVAALSGSGFNSMVSKNMISMKGYAGRGAYGEDTPQHKMWTKMRGAGYSEYATAGAMGNVEMESKFNPAIIEKGNGVGFGLCQWSYGRRKQLEGFANARNMSPSDIDLQLDFLLAELNKNTKDPNVSYQLLDSKSTGYTADSWRNATDLKTATEAFCFTFERPAAATAHLNDRIAAAQRYYQEFTGVPGVVGGSTYASVDTASANNMNITEEPQNNNTGGNILTKMLSAVDSVASFFGFGDRNVETTTNAETQTTDDSSGLVTTNTSSLTGNVSPNPEHAEKQRQLVAKMKSIQNSIKYSQSGPRNPDKGSADCSSVASWAYKKVLGVDPGNNTTAQREDPDTYTVATNVNDESKLQLGDLLLRDGHVEMYEGNGKMIGHGGPDLGPTEKTLGKHPNGKPFNLVRRWKGFNDAGSGSGLGSELQTDLQHSSPIAVKASSKYSASSEMQTNSPNTTIHNIQTPIVQSNDQLVNVLNSISKSITMVVSNTSVIREIASLLVKLSDLYSSSVTSSVGDPGTDQSTSQAILNNAKEIANTKASLVKLLSTTAKQSDSVDLSSLIKSVESITVQ